MSIFLKTSFLGGKVSEHEIKMHNLLVFGRSSKADVVIDDPKISSLHCRFHFKKDTLEVTDLDSKNGTYLNGIKMTNSSMFLGDSIKFGNTVISINSAKMDQDTIELVTFGGSNRFDATARSDFTSVMSNKPEPAPKLQNPADLDRRPLTKRKAPPTKKDIKSQHKNLASVAILIDVCLLIFFAFIPVFFFESPSKMSIEISSVKSDKLFFVLITELICVVGFFIWNFKMMEFSIGERLSGIKKLCR